MSWKPLGQPSCPSVYRINSVTKEEKRIIKMLSAIERKRKQKEWLSKKRSALTQRQPEGEEGIAVNIGPGICAVRIGAVTQTCQSIPGVAIGDRVTAARQRVSAILPRRTTLSRPDPHNPNLERILAANIDIVVMVVSLSSPPLRPGLIDRCLIAIQYGGAQPILCVNKVDLPHEIDLRIFDVYRQIGVPVLFCSASSGAGLDELRALLAGNTSVFVGHSGVGKSSLLNALSSHLDLRTGEAGRKGRHTTTSSGVFLLNGGITVIDTPGIREFGLWNISPGDLRHYFPEFEEPSKSCSFANCTHTHEPRCGVRDAGLQRYPAYLRCLRST
jgi:ribosome biogenesis GTPase